MERKMRRGADRSSVLPTRSRENNQHNQHNIYRNVADEKPIEKKDSLFFVSSAAWQTIAGIPIVDVDHVSPVISGLTEKRAVRCEPGG